MRGVHAHSGSGDCTNLSAAVDQRQLRCDQSFEDRWSIIPKAHAEESQDTDQRTSPAPPTETTGPQPQTDAAKPTCDAHDGSTIGTSGRSFSGKASFYSYHSGKNGERFGIRPRSANRCSSPLPFGTEVRATNVANNKSLVVTITDRGAHKPDRALDLSLNAARTSGITDRGVAEIRAEVL